MRPLLAPPFRQVAAAVDTSPRLLGVLAEAGRFARRLEAPLLLIHAGPPEAQKEAAFRDALLKVGLSRATRLMWQTGSTTPPRLQRPEHIARSPGLAGCGCGG